MNKSHQEDPQEPLDSLTGALDRRALTARLEQLRAAEAPFAIVAIDLDHFKSVNDAFGHVRGDEVLIEVARRLRASIRGRDSLVRLGGDEFVALLGGGQRAVAENVARRMLRAVAIEPFEGSPPLRLTLSMGLACWPDDADDPQALYELADQRAYVSKRQGRNRLTCDGSASQSVDEGLDAASRLIERDEAIARAQRFLTELRSRGRGAMAVQSAPEVGLSRYMNEVGRRARAQGFTVVTLRTSTVLRQRHGGALATMTMEGGLLPAPEFWTLGRFEEELSQNHSDGLLVLVDGLAGLDRATLEVLQRSVGHSNRVEGVIYATEASAGPRRHRLPLLGRVRLLPLSVVGCRLWLRHALQWEAPDEVVRWLWQHSQGLPGRMKRLLERSRRSGALTQRADGWQLSLERLTEADAEEEAPTPVFPSLDDGFIGRAKELYTIKQVLARHRLVTLVGSGGIGKTRLGLQAVAEFSEEGSGAEVCLVELGEVRAANLLPQAVGLALGLEPGRAAQMSLDGLLRLVHDRRMLLLMDNFEHLLDAAPQLNTILEHAPELTILVTSRQPLGLNAEVVVPIQGLSIPPSADAADFEHYGAVALLTERARRAGAPMGRWSSARRAVWSLCREVGGMPLALNLAAAWVPLAPIEEIAEAVGQDLDLFLEQAPGQSGGVRKVIAYFWAMLSEHEQRAVRALVVFEDPFTAQAAREVAQASPFLLLGLLDRSFVHRDRRQRFAIHGLLRRFALRQLQAHPEQERQARERHAEFFGRFVATWRHDGAAPDAFEDIMAAWRWRINHPKPQWFSRACAPTEQALDFRGRLHLHCELFRDAARAVLCRFPEEIEVLTELRIAYARALHRAGRWEEALRITSKARHALEPLGMTRLLGVCDGLLGTCMEHAGDWAQAQVHYGHALDVFRACEDGEGVRATLVHLGQLAEERGDFVRARRYLEEVVALNRASEDWVSLASGLNSLGVLEMHSGELECAREHLHECLEVSRKVGFGIMEAYATTTLAEVEFEAQRLEACTTFLQEADTMAQALKERLLHAHIKILQARLSLAKDQVAEAHMALLVALELAEGLSSVPLILRAGVGLAQLWSGAGAQKTVLELLDGIIAHNATEHSTRLWAEALLVKMRGESSPQTSQEIDVGALEMLMALVTTDP